MFRSLLRALAVALPWLCSGLLFVPDPRQVDASGSCWPPPVEGVVVDPFRPPTCPWCAGNRGIEYATAPDAVVRSVTAGQVTFAGAVAGTRYVVVQLPNGWRLTYGRLEDITVAAGSSVLTGTPVGRAGGALFFGLRIGDEYVDPAPHLGEWIGVRRLIPTDGSPPRSAPPPRLSCGDSGSMPPGSGSRSHGGTVGVDDHAGNRVTRGVDGHTETPGTADPIAGGTSLRHR